MFQLGFEVMEAILFCKLLPLKEGARQEVCILFKIYQEIGNLSGSYHEIIESVLNVHFLPVCICKKFSITFFHEIMVIDIIFRK